MRDASLICTKGSAYRAKDKMDAITRTGPCCLPSARDDIGHSFDDRNVGHY